MDAKWRQLQPGDRVRLLGVPHADWQQRERELREGAEMPGWTADSLERIIARTPIVMINRVDEYGAPWFDCVLPGPDGNSEFHSLTITDDDSWELLIVAPIAQPTPEMFAFSERRTREHIARVAANLLLMAQVSPHGEKLTGRAEEHDASKFSLDELVPYVWLSEFHRARKSGEPFTYPPGVEAEVRYAIQHHLLSNRHHPEFHADPNDMTEVDLIEMVCDWTAMAQEFGQDGGSARGWADKTIGQRVAFDAAKADFIYRKIAELDQRIASRRD